MLPCILVAVSNQLHFLREHRCSNRCFNNLPANLSFLADYLPSLGSLKNYQNTMAKTVRKAKKFIGTPSPRAFTNTVLAQNGCVDR